MSVEAFPFIFLGIYCGIYLIILAGMITGLTLGLLYGFKIMNDAKQRRIEKAAQTYYIVEFVLAGVSVMTGLGIIAFIVAIVIWKQYLKNRDTLPRDPPPMGSCHYFTPEPEDQTDRRDRKS